MSKYCTKCGKEVDDALNFCPYCGHSFSAAPRSSDRFFRNAGIMAVCIVGFFVFVWISARISGLHSEPTYYEPGEYDAIAASTTSEMDYKESCDFIPYRDVARNPTNYVGAKAVYTGKVIQVLESGKKVVLRVNVTQGKYGSWDDTVYVEYRRKSDKESRILEDDIITMYGEIQGIKEYTSVFLSQVSVPHLKAEYIEIHGTYN